MSTESAAITSNAAGRCARRYSQQRRGSENTVPSTSLGNHCGLDPPRQSAAIHRGGGKVAGSGLAVSQSHQQISATARGSIPHERARLGDITNLAENGCQNLEGKHSIGYLAKREPSAALQATTTGYGTGLAPARAMGAARLPARPVAPPLTQTLTALESVSPVPTEMSISEYEQDAVKRSNPQECQEYESEIVAGLFAEESLHMPRPDYMANQANLNGKMRGILIDWLVEVHMKYKLRRETLYLAVSLIDRYMAKMPVPRNRLQLVGVVGMFVAAKFEQINPPPVVDFVYITDNTFTKEDIMSMECDMLSALSFSVVVPTQAHFFDYLLKANQSNAEEYRALVDYLLELALVDLRMIKHAPSRLVSAALLLSNEIVGRPAWPQAMVQISRYSDAALRGCVDEFRALLRAAPSGALQAVRKKYSLQQRCCVAKLPRVLAA